MLLDDGIQLFNGFVVRLVGLQFPYERLQETKNRVRRNERWGQDESEGQDGGGGEVETKTNRLTVTVRSIDRTTLIADNKKTHRTVVSHTILNFTSDAHSWYSLGRAHISSVE